eukprot:1302496-Amorphochlora_amoeboformis.AAC.2
MEGASARKVIGTNVWRAISSKGQRIEDSWNLGSDGSLSGSGKQFSIANPSVSWQRRIKGAWSPRSARLRVVVEFIDHMGNAVSSFKYSGGLFMSAEGIFARLCREAKSRTRRVPLIFTMDVKGFTLVRDFNI